MPYPNYIGNLQLETLADVPTSGASSQWFLCRDRLFVGTDLVGTQSGAIAIAETAISKGQFLALVSVSGVLTARIADIDIGLAANSIAAHSAIAGDRVVAITRYGAVILMDGYFDGDYFLDRGGLATRSPNPYRFQRIGRATDSELIFNPGLLEVAQEPPVVLPPAIPAINFSVAPVTQPEGTPPTVVNFSISPATQPEGTIPILNVYPGTPATGFTFEIANPIAIDLSISYSLTPYAFNTAQTPTYEITILSAGQTSVNVPFVIPSYITQGSLLLIIYTYPNCNYTLTQFNASASIPYP